MGKLGNVNAARSRSPARRATVLGANGITLEYPVIRHMNNLESVVTYEGTARRPRARDRRRADRHPGVPLMELLTAQQAAVTWLRRAIVEGDLRPASGSARTTSPPGSGCRDPGPRGAARARVRGRGHVRGPEGLLRHRARPRRPRGDLPPARPARAGRGGTRPAARDRRRPRRAGRGGRGLPGGRRARRRAGGAGGQPALPLRALRAGRLRARAAADPAAVGRHGGLPRAVLRHARRRGRRRPGARAIVTAARERDVPRCVAELAAHRGQALEALRAILTR